MSSAAERGTPRWIGLSGLVFVGLLIAAIPIGTAPEADASDGTILDYYTDSTNQTKQMVAAIILGAAIIAFLVFVAGMRGFLLAAGANPALADTAFAGGLAAGVLALGGWAIGAAVPATFVFSDTIELDADTARVVLTAGNIMLVSFGGAVGSLLVGAVSLASRRTELLPSWLTWTGLMAAPLMVLTLPLFGLPAIALAAWVLAVSIALLVRGRAAAEQS